MLSADNVLYSEYNMPPKKFTTPGLVKDKATLKKLEGRDQGPGEQAKVGAMKVDSKASAGSMSSSGKAAQDKRSDKKGKGKEK